MILLEERSFGLWLEKDESVGDNTQVANDAGEVVFERSHDIQDALLAFELEVEVVDAHLVISLKLDLLGTQLTNGLYQEDGLPFVVFFVIEVDVKVRVMNEALSYQTVLKGVERHVAVCSRGHV